MRVKKVEYVDRYKLKLLFSDKKTKIVDIAPIISKSKGLFHPLRDIEYFKKVSLDDDQYPLSICWPNGADLCPNVLYEMGQDVKTTTKKTPHKRKKSVLPVSESKKPQAKISPKSKH
jgi:hypothetical protein